GPRAGPARAPRGGGRRVRAGAPAGPASPAGPAIPGRGRRPHRHERGGGVRDARPRARRGAGRPGSRRGLSVLGASPVVPPPSTGDERRVVPFDVNAFGPHPTFLRILMEDWGRRRRPGRLLAVVSPRFAESQPAPVADLAASVDVVPIAEAELDRIKRAAGMRIAPDEH